MKTKSNIKIAVALSGGVDSAVAAKKLVDEGHEVIGLFLKLWKIGDGDESEERAKKVAKHLNIPFYVIDAGREFKDVVVSDFIYQYSNLKTPNPCIVCNPLVKFKLLISKASELKCDFVATGHYARVNQKSKIKNQNDNLKSKSDSNAFYYSLHSGIDKTKDQSYMLHRLNQDQLSKILFPLGELTKKEVREMAKNWNLPVAEQPESQEICFLQNSNYRDFLRQNLPADYFKPGDIADVKGNIIGRHEGLVNYTIGQRKNINQNVNIKNQNDNSKIQNKKPLYVVGFDVEKNQLFVGKDRDTYRREMIVTNVNWINPHYSSFMIHNSSLLVKIRSQAKAVACRIMNDELGTKGELKIEFNEPQRAVTPGQSAVFYLGEEVVGGGIIKEKIYN